MASKRGTISVSMRYWLIKSDPETYDWARLVRDGGTRWDGVRNALAKRFLSEMAIGDEALFYHSQTDKAVVGTVRITKTAYPDPTASSGSWLCVDIKPQEAWKNPVTLAELKRDARLTGLVMLRQSRLSVSPVSAREWRVIQGLRSAV